MAASTDVVTILTESFESMRLSNANYKKLFDTSRTLQKALNQVSTKDSGIAPKIGWLVDDSGSIPERGNTQSVRDGYNSVRNALIQNPRLVTSVVLTQYLNGKTLCSFSPLSESPILDAQNYDSRYFGGTPLYDRSFEFLSLMFVEGERFHQVGFCTRSISFIISDGEDCKSDVRSANDVKQLVKDVTATGTHHVIGIGIGKKNSLFESIFNSMGINDVFTADDNAASILRVFDHMAELASSRLLLPQSTVAGVISL